MPVAAPWVRRVPRRGRPPFRIIRGGVPGTITYPTTPLQVRVRIALGADLSASPLTWAWRDITEYVRFTPGIEITPGRRDWSEFVTASVCRLTLDNTGGRFSRRNPNSEFYGQLSKSTPIWVEVNPGDNYHTRFTGFVAEWPVRWREKGRDSLVPIEAAGILCRLQIGGTAISAIRQAILSDTTAPLAYWPCDDGANATSITNAVSGAKDGWINASGRVSPGRAVGLYAGEPGLLYGLTNTGSPATTTGRTGGVVVLPVPDHVSTGTEIITWWHRWEPLRDPIAPAGATDAYLNHRINFVGATGTHIRLYFQETDGSATTGAVYFFDADGVWTGIDLTTTADLHDGNWHELQLRLTQSGADTLAELWVDDSQVDTTTVTSYTLGTASRFVAGADASYDSGATIGSSYEGPFELGHVSVHTNSAVGRFYDAGTGYTGEMAHVRMARVAAAAGIRFTCVAAESARMGPQPTAKPLDIMRECEAADRGVLYEWDWGLAYQAVSERYNAPVGLSLDFDQHHIANEPEPADDYQRTANKWTVSRTNGASVTVEQTTGPMGTGADGPGTFEYPAQVNVESDLHLTNQGGWRVHLGTVDEDRWPVLDIRMHRTPDLITSWLNVRVGTRVTVENPPTEVAPDAIDAVIEGYRERVDTFTWEASLNTSPASPYNVALYGSETSANGSGTHRWDTAGSETAAEFVAGTDTSMSVTTTLGPVWTTDADDFPFNIRCFGVVLEVTNISGSSSPQTFTITQTPVNGVSKTIPAGEPLSLASPVYWAL